MQDVRGKHVLQFRTSTTGCIDVSHVTRVSINNQVEMDPAYCFLAPKITAIIHKTRLKSHATPLYSKLHLPGFVQPVTRASDMVARMFQKLLFYMAPRKCTCYVMQAITSMPSDFHNLQQKHV